MRKEKEKIDSRMKQIQKFVSQIFMPLVPMNNKGGSKIFSK